MWVYFMKNSVIALKSRIEYYIKAAKIANAVEAKQYSKDVDDLIEKDGLFQILVVFRDLKSLGLKMGEQRNTIIMYLESDIDKLYKMMKDRTKNNGRGFVETMKQINYSYQTDPGDSMERDEQLRKIGYQKVLTNSSVPKSVSSLYTNAA